jgi:agmatine/peptidylarginine deiminase
MPAEWEKHEGTWLQWPHDDTHPGSQMRLEHVVANNVVLVPVYGDVTDARAKAIVAEHFPGREIVGILAHTLAELGGMIHCVTQQQPVSRFKETS